MNYLTPILNSFNETSLPLYLLTGGVLFLCVTTIILLHITRKLKKEYAQVKDMREDLKAFSVAAIGVGKRVLQLEHRQRIANKKIESTSKAPEKIVTYVEPANQTYDEAAYMAKQGQNVESIMHRCGLSHSEAELIFLMNRLDKVS